MNDLIEHTNVDEFDDSEYVDMSLRATILHHTDNGEGDTNRHAVILGKDVFVVEHTDD